MKTKYDSLCETGLKRSENQDSIFSAYNGEIGVFAIADGMGGHSDGAYASQKIISEFKALWDNIRYSNFTLESLTEKVLAAIEKVNSELFGYSEEHGIICGSTVSVLLICEKKYAVINAGDSPVFMVNIHTSQHITVEHSYGEMVRKSGGDEKDIPQHRKNRLTMAVGIAPKIYPDVSCNNMDERSVFLLCSDGVTRYHSDKDIYTRLKKILKDKESYPETLTEIKNHVEESGAADNFSAIIVDCSEIDPEADSLFSSQRVLRLIIMLAVLTAIICGFIFALQLLK